MKSEARNKYFKLNDIILETSDDHHIFQEIVKPSIYEVIRVIDGVPIFLDDHLDRMFTSASIIDYEMSYNKDEIKNSIKEVILKNEVKNQNIKLLGSTVDNDRVFLIYFKDSFYPPKEYYNNGIKTILYEHERDNPNAKVQVNNFRKDVEGAREKNNAFEALLVNKEGYIPEGSRSNIFFVKNDQIYTAPSDQVLLGITRKYIFSVAEILNIDIIEKTIHKDDIRKLEGAFMTSTSVDVLPITRIDNMIIESTDNEVIRNLNASYNDLIKNFIKKNKSHWE